MPEMNETMNELVVISGHLYSHCLASTPLPPSQPNSHPIPPSNQPTAMSSMPELPDQWTSTAEKDTEGNEKPRPPRYRAKRQYTGREQEAEEVKGEGQWASLGELLM
ncbi:unnamed protein product [Cutaneotrichosporon oleaginosum]